MILATWWRSSGTTSRRPIAYGVPEESRASSHAGPPRSSRSPRATPSDTVTIATRIVMPALFPIQQGLLPPEASRPAARLSQKHDLADLDRAVERLGHVVESEARAGDGRQRLHLDAGPRGRRCGRGDDDFPGSGDELTLDRDRVETDRVSEGHDFGGLLGGQDPRQARHRQGVPFRQLPRGERSEGCRVQTDFPAGNGAPARRGVSPHIHHPRPAAGIQMKEAPPQGSRRAGTARLLRRLSFLRHALSRIAAYSSIVLMLAKEFPEGSSALQTSSGTVSAPTSSASP